MSKILNLAKLDRKLKRLPDVAKTHVRSEMGKVADTIVSMMKSLVPKVDGALRDSIGWTWGKAPQGASVVAVAKSTLGSDLTITIYAGSTEAYYARWVEFGTAAHINGGMFKGSKNPGTNARPYFYVSWRANKKSAVRAVRKATRESARKVAAGS
ncbi:HK97 gp10 family phage protein [Agrobacterium vitis]